MIKIKIKKNILTRSQNIIYSENDRKLGGEGYTCIFILKKCTQSFPHKTTIHPQRRAKISLINKTTIFE